MLRNRRNLTAARRNRRNRSTSCIDFVVLKNVCEAEADIVSFIKDSDFFKEQTKKNTIVLTDSEGTIPFPVRNA